MPGNRGRLRYVVRPEDGAPELVESDVKASVYAPRATKCVFQRRGQEPIVDVRTTVYVPSQTRF